MDPLVSLIVPIYGVEAYVEQCARSVLAQTYENVEFIFVNDGTPDRSMDILAEVVKDFPERNVVIVNKENGGLPHASARCERGLREPRSAPLDIDRRGDALGPEGDG